MNILIIGGGDTGFTLASLLSEKDKVSILEKEENIAKELANKTSALVVHGDGTDTSVLKEAGIEEVDVVIATTGDDKVNLMVCEISKNEKVKRIISLVNSPQNEELFTKLEITSLVSVVAAKVSGIKSVLQDKSTIQIAKTTKDVLEEDKKSKTK